MLMMNIVTQPWAELILSVSIFNNITHYCFILKHVLSASANTFYNNDFTMDFNVYFITK